MHKGNSVAFSLRPAICVSLLGFASWIVVNGVWVELPLLVTQLPEGWNLPAYLSILIQIANLGPLIYVPVTKLCRSIGTGFCAQCVQPPERLANYVILSVGCVSCVLLAHLWDRVAPFPGLGNVNHSFGLLILALCAAIVDCSSSVTFISYLTGMPEAYVGALAFGEAFSDLVPSSLSLIQGVSSTVECVNVTVNGSSTIVPHYAPPRFSVTVFMYCLALTLAISLGAFAMLDLSSWGLGKAVRRRYQSIMHSIPDHDETGIEVIIDRYEAPRLENSSSTETVISTVHQTVNTSELSRSAMESDPTLLVIRPEPPIPTDKRRQFLLNTKEFILPVALLGYASLLTNGFLPAFQSYSSASYNNLTYHLAVTLSGLMGAFVSLVATFLVHRNTRARKLKSALNSQDLTASGGHQFLSNLPMTRAIAARPYRLHSIWILMAALSTVPAAYVIYVAAKSPNPPDMNGFGEILVVLAWILLRFGFAGLRTWLWLYLSSRSCEAMALRLAGLATQVGALFGAVASFLLVVQFQMFTIKPPC